MEAFNPLFEKKIENSDGSILISLVNGIRRSIMCDIEVYCIDMESTIFYENTSTLDNEFLNKRLALIPIISDYTDVVYENVRIECKVKNSTHDIMSVYFSDLQFKDDRGSPIEKEFCYFPKILFNKLKPNQSISFETRLIKQNSQNGGAHFNPTAVCVHTFEIDESALEKKIKDTSMSESAARTFLLDEAETYYKKNENGVPSVYHLKIESTGHMNPMTIYRTGIERLRDRIMIAKDEMNLKNSEKITISKNKKSDEVYDVIFMEENDTLGNILSEYLSIDEEVKYVGYRLVHPLKYEMHMKIVLHQNNEKEHIVKKYIEVMNKILKILDTLSS